MKKLVASAIFIGLSGLYVLYRPQIAVQTTASTSSVSGTTGPNNSGIVPVIRRMISDDDDDGPRVITPNPTPTPPAPPSQTPSKTIYKDGTYIGSVADAFYGLVQVKATIVKGRIIDVVFLSYPSDRSTSVSINSQAMPYLTQEAIQAQTANVNIISGATETSLAFKQSLSFALVSAKI